MDEFMKMGSRVVTPMPELIAHDSLRGMFGCSGDIGNVPPCCATIGPKDVVEARERFEVHNILNSQCGDSWQRMISRIELYGPISMECPASIFRLGKGTCYVSEAIARPFHCWYNGIPDDQI